MKSEQHFTDLLWSQFFHFKLCDNNPTFISIKQFVLDWVYSFFWLLPASLYHWGKKPSVFVWNYVLNIKVWISFHFTDAFGCLCTLCLSTGIHTQQAQGSLENIGKSVDDLFISLPPSQDKLSFFLFKIFTFIFNVYYPNNINFFLIFSTRFQALNPFLRDVSKDCHIPSLKTLCVKRQATLSLFILFPIKSLFIFYSLQRLH